MLKASFLRCTSKSRVRALRVATGIKSLEMMKAKPLSMKEKITRGRITFHMEMPEAFMATNS